MRPQAMNRKLLLLFFLFHISFLLSEEASHEVQPSTAATNITVVGTVFCDACSENTFSNHSYFLQGVKVQIMCEFSTKTTPGEQISINAERTTDKFGTYRIDIPPVDGFECREGRALQSFCNAKLVQSPSPLCNLPSLSASTEHLALKAGDSSACVYCLNALSYKPHERDASSCGKNRAEEASLVASEPNNSLFFWPPFFAWPYWPSYPFPFPIPFPRPPYFPFPFPFPSPTSFPTPFPFPNPSPPSFPFPFIPIPFLTPPPTAFPFPFPPFFPAPSPPALPFPPIPFLTTPSPPPPSLPFPFPPLPPFNPLPSLFPSPPPPPSSPPPAFPFPFPQFPPFFPFPRPPSPPTQALSSTKVPKQIQKP